VGWVRTALGVGHDEPIEIESVQRWSASADTADRFSSGRVFLVGDAAHVMPPTGGFGGNTGVADAHNLAWKLAMVTQGRAGHGLLESYDPERRPVSGLTVEQAYTRYVQRVDPSLSQENLQPPLDDASIELGAVYRSDAVLASDEPGASLDDPRSRSWAVGTRVPHVPLDDGRSTVDLAGHGFAVLVAAADEDWRKVADEVERQHSVPVVVHEVRDDGLEGAVLVRPDGVIAWQTQESAAASGLDSAVSRLLGRAG
jgi:hypothetical protein